MRGLLTTCLTLSLTLGAAAGAAPTATAPAPVTRPVDVPPPMKPNLKWTTVEKYEAQIGEPGVLLQDDHVLLFAPTRKAKEAKIIFGYLVRAYGELRAIVGQQT